jgi:N-acetyl-anhydromuramyl-L-alanine amidase AmpD
MSRRIASAADELAGSVDFVGQKSDGSYVIMDWKTSKKLNDQGWDKAYGKKAYYPIEHVNDCEKNKYTMQLNLYKYILEQHYGLQISSMVIASFQESYSPYFYTEVDDMGDEVRKILEDFRSKNKDLDGLNFSFEALDISDKI